MIGPNAPGMLITAIIASLILTIIFLVGSQVLTDIQSHQEVNSPAYNITGRGLEALSILIPMLLLIILILTQIP